MPNQLWIDPPVLTFKHDQEDQLKKTLDLDRNLVISPITKPQDVVLDAEANIGLTFGAGQRKYKLTRWGLFQLCQLACPSLYGFILDLSGVNRTKDTNREDYSFTDALDILNRVIRRRFRTQLQDKLALVDMARGTIDGFVSGAYHRLPNYELYDRTSDAMGQSKDASFFEAVIAGRWMMLRYIN